MLIPSTCARQHAAATLAGSEGVQSFCLIPVISRFGQRRLCEDTQSRHNLHGAVWTQHNGKGAACSLAASSKYLDELSFLAFALVS